MRDDLEKIVCNCHFLLFATGLTLIVGQVGLAWILTKEQENLWLVLPLITEVQHFFLRLIGANLYQKYQIFFGSHILVVTLLCLIWTAFHALQIKNQLDNQNWFGTSTLYILSLLSSWIGFSVITSFYNGTLY